MIVYRPQERDVRTAEVVAEIVGLAREVRSHEQLVDLLIRFGEFEAAAADAGSPAPGLRDTAVLIGRQFAAKVYRPVPMPRFETLHLPPTLRITVPEGFAFYGLYPEAYLEAARRFARECTPREVCVIGIRSIGATLSAVVAGALQQAGSVTRTYTVRPHGHPFNRSLDIPCDLEREWLEQQGYFAVVDEGPGLSGSSFTSVLKKLEELGVARNRVVLFSSWEGDAGRLLNQDARTLWPLYRKYYSVFDPAWIDAPPSNRDLSAGQWRDCVIGTPAHYPAVQPQHEALKFLAGGTLYKFSGLGRYGEAKYQRASALAGAGFTPEPVLCANGFIGFEFGGFGPLRAERGVPDFAAYLAFRSRRFPAQRSLDFDQLLDMIRFNTGGSTRALEALRQEFDDRPACAVDGRMLPHEFVESEHGWLKTDSVDHCADHFFPGGADIVWDLAGASVEFDMGPHERERMLCRYRCESGDDVSPELMSFYEVAYAAFRFGYASMAAESTAGTAEEPRFEALRRKYRAVFTPKMPMPPFGTSGSDQGRSDNRPGVDAE